MIVTKLIILPLILGWQVQGGHQNLQVTAPVQRTLTVQGSQEDSDTLQPAMGFNTLDSTGQAIQPHFQYQILRHGGGYWHN